MTSQDGPFYFEDFAVGQRFVTRGRTVTEADIVMFIAVSHLIEPLFVDMDYVAKESLYGGRIAPGAMTYSIAEGLVVQMGLLHGTALAFLQTEFVTPAPVYAGDTLRVIQEIEATRMTSRGDRGVVTFKETVLNQKDQEVLVRTTRRLILARDAQRSPNE